MPKKKSSYKGRLFFLFLVTGAVAYYYFRPAAPPLRNDAVRRPVLAILTLENIDKKPELDFLSRSLTRETIARVGQVCSGKLDVVAYPSVSTYAVARKSIQQIGRELKVDYILQGTFRRAQEQLDFTVQLIRVSGEARLWTHEYSSSLDTVTTVQNQVIESLASALDIKIDAGVYDALNLATTRNAGAREAYLRGVDLCQSESGDDLKKCVAAFEQAIKLDPGFPRAHAALADAVLRLRSDPDVAEKEARRALERSDAIMQAHLVLAEVQYRYRDNDAGADKAFNRAIELNQSDATAPLRYSAFLLEKNRLSDALTQIQRTLALDPLSLEANLLKGRILTAAKLYDQAIQQLSSTVSLDRNSPAIRFYLGQAYRERAMYADAIREFERAVSFGPETPQYIAALGQAYAAVQRYDDARAQLASLKVLARKRHVAPQLLENLSAAISADK